MILPLAGDAQVLLGQALFAEPQFFQQPPAGLVVGEAGGFGAVEAEGAIGEVEEREERLAHVALAGEGGAHPVAEAGALGDPAAQVAKGDAPQELLVAGAPPVPNGTTSRS